MIPISCSLLNNRREPAIHKFEPWCIYFQRYSRWCRIRYKCSFLWEFV